MIPPETPVGSRVRVYAVQGDEATAWAAETTTPVGSGRVAVKSNDGRCGQFDVSHVEPIGAKPFPPLPQKFKCPHCEREFER